MDRQIPLLNKTLPALDTAVRPLNAVTPQMGRQTPFPPERLPTLVADVRPPPAFGGELPRHSGKALKKRSVLFRTGELVTFSVAGSAQTLIVNCVQVGATGVLWNGIGANGERNDVERSIHKTK